MDDQDLSLQLGVVLDQAWAYHPANSKNKLEGPSVKYCFSCDIASSKLQKQIPFLSTYHTDTQRRNNDRGHKTYDGFLFKLQNFSCMRGFLHQTYTCRKLRFFHRKVTAQPCEPFLNFVLNV